MTSRNNHPLTPERIKALRASLGLTQFHFAIRLGVSPQAVAHWEQGRRTPTGLYAQALDDLIAEAKGQSRR